MISAHIICEFASRSFWLECVCVCVCVWVCVTPVTRAAAMEGLRLVGSLKIEDSFAKEPHQTDCILQKRPIIWRSLRIIATPWCGICVLMSSVHIVCTYRVYMSRVSLISQYIGCAYWVCMSRVSLLSILCILYVHIEYTCLEYHSYPNTRDSRSISGVHIEYTCLEYHYWAYVHIVHMVCTY